MHIVIGIAQMHISGYNISGHTFHFLMAVYTVMCRVHSVLCSFRPATAQLQTA